MSTRFQLPPSPKLYEGVVSCLFIFTPSIFWLEIDFNSVSVNLNPIALAMEAISFAVAKLETLSYSVLSVRIATRNLFNSSIDICCWQID